MSTLVEVTCVSKKEKAHWSKEYPRAWEIELEVPYGENNIFWKLSGGTNLMLNTCNPAAADQFEIGGKFEVVISKKVEELTPAA